MPTSMKRVNNLNYMLEFEYNLDTFDYLPLVNKEVMCHA